METKQFTRLLVGICLALLATIIAISIALFNNGPRVRLVSFSQNTTTISLSRGSAITVRFDRPLDDRDYTDQIRFEPALDFNATTASQTITITLQTTMLSNTEYSLIVEPGIYDRTGRVMSDQYIHTFQTGQPRYAYIERNYGIVDTDAIFVTTDQDDHVMVGQIGSEPTSVFAHPEITMLAANRNWVVLATKGDLTDSLYSIDMRTDEVVQHQLTIQGRIRSLTLAPEGVAALYTLTPDFDTVSPEVYDAQANRLESLNLATGETISLTNADDDLFQAFSVRLDTKGRIALVHDSQQRYYAVSPFNDFPPSLLGTYSESFGFNYDATQIVFRDRDNIINYDIASATASQLNIDQLGFIRSITDDQRSKTLFTTTYSADGSTDVVYTLDDWTSQPQVLFSNAESSDTSVLDVTNSYDKRLLAIQSNPLECTFDSVTPNTQCIDTKTAIYDTLTQEPITDLPGFNFIWLP